MVDRLQIAIYDFDGTLYEGRSLNDFFIFGAKKLLLSGKILTSIVIILGIIIRALIPSLKIWTKYNLVKVIESKFDDSDYIYFVEKYSCKINEKIVSELEKDEVNGVVPVLISASPHSYISKFGEKYGMKFTIGTATTMRYTGYSEVRGDGKVVAIKSLFRHNEYDIVKIVTDHHDDLPLIKAFNPAEAVLVKPSVELIDYFVKNSGKMRYGNTIVCHRFIL